MSFSYTSVSQNVLRESIGQTLQLSFAPNLDMSHSIPGFTRYRTEILPELLDECSVVSIVMKTYTTEELVGELRTISAFRGKLVATSTRGGGAQ
jgi:hypothetical protein